jgi:hypothetical protein
LAQIRKERGDDDVHDDHQIALLPKSADHSINVGHGMTGAVMCDVQETYRQLYEALLEYEGEAAHHDVLVPWAEANPPEKAWLRAFALRPGDPVPAADENELCRLYAISRINDLLLLRFQPAGPGGLDHPGPAVTPAEYLSFMSGLGFEVVDGDVFHPFVHEVVEVDQRPNDDAPVVLLERLWPTLMLGPMLFSRGGVRVGGGRRHIDKEVAQSSRLYWTHRRRNRPYTDLSVGWGSNSQWRTDFRRDYWIGNRLFFNVDGKGRRQDGLDDGLTPEERTELLVYRCFIRGDSHLDQDFWPYDDVLDLPADGIDGPRSPAGSAGGSPAR